MQLMETLTKCFASPAMSSIRKRRGFMETRLGHSFAHVRVHADSMGEKSARALQADAYTLGNHIVFAAGRYAPNSNAGQQLLAHELTHVVQQTGVPGVIQRKPSSNDDDWDRIHDTDGIDDSQSDADWVDGLPFVKSQPVPHNANQGVSKAVQSQEDATRDERLVFLGAILLQRGFGRSSIEKYLDAHYSPKDRAILLHFARESEGSADYENDDYGEVPRESEEDYQKKLIAGVRAYHNGSVKNKQPAGEPTEMREQRKQELSAEPGMRISLT
jgi:Domain of unknown function (DUF4157)